MILLIARATPEDQPVVTTPETIAARGEQLSEVLSGLVDRLLPVMTSVSGVVPIEVTIAVQWADGRETTIPMPAPGTKVPPHLS